MTRAFIEGRVDDFHYRVRIPILNKLSSSVGATPTNELAVATIATPPGISPKFRTGDLVFIEYEENDTSKPVIVGRMFNTLTSNIASDAYFDSVTVSVNATLPKDSNVGDTTSQNLIYLNGLNSNIQYQLDNINIEKDNLQTQINEISFELNSLQKDITQLQTQFKDVVKDIQTIQDNITSIKNDITSINNKNNTYGL